MLGWLIVVLLGASALYLGAAFPNDLVAGVVLGITVASLVHLVFGSPGTRPTIPQITDALARLGVDAHNVRFATDQPTSSTLVLAEDERGPLRIRVVGRDDAHHQLLAKLWTSLVNKGSTSHFVLTREQQVEHEAYLMLVAAQADVHVPTVVVAGRAGPRAALLVQRPVEGTRLTDLDPEAISDELLRRLWVDVDALRGARVVHGDLDADHVIIVAEQPWIVAFDDATISGDPHDHAADTAQLLASTAALVGDERAVAAAVAVTGRPAVMLALPLLQAAALSSSTRTLSGGGRREFGDRLERLRAGRRGCDRHRGTGAGADPSHHRDQRRHGDRCARGRRRAARRCR